MVGRPLIGDLARDRFLATPPPEPFAEAHKFEACVQRAQDAAGGELPGYSVEGGLPDTLSGAGSQAVVSNDTWRQAEALAQVFLVPINSIPGFSARF